MRTHNTHQPLASLGRGLAACLSAMAGLAIAMPAHAAPLTPRDEAKVGAGMTTSQVRAALGRPLHIEHVSGGRTTWTYALAGHQVVNDDVFDVDFGPDGTVRSMETRLELGAS